jgi:hypothetical protein
VFLGHFAVGFAAKRAAPRTALGALLLAPLLLDLVWPIFLLLGIERAAIAPGDTAVTPLRFEHYPYSHSLAMAVAWAGLAALCGLGLWNSVAGTVALEAAMFAAGLGIYAAATRPLDRRGTRALLALVIVLSLLYVANLLGPPPPDARDPHRPYDRLPGAEASAPAGPLSFPTKHHDVHRRPPMSDPLKLIAALGVIVLGVRSIAWAEPPKGGSKAFPYAIQQTALENGLKVVTIPFDSPGIVAFWIVVRTGSRNEIEPG